MSNNPHRETDLLVSLGSEMRNRRKDMGLTLETLSERCGVTQNYLGTIEAGKRDVSVSTLAKIADGFACPIGALFGFEAKEHSLSASGVDMARRIDALPEHLRRHMMGLLKGLEAQE